MHACRSSKIRNLMRIEFCNPTMCILPPPSQVNPPRALFVPPFAGSILFVPGTPGQGPDPVRIRSAPGPTPGTGPDPVRTGYNTIGEGGKGGREDWRDLVRTRARTEGGRTCGTPSGHGPDPVRTQPGLCLDLSGARSGPGRGRGYIILYI